MVFPALAMGFAFATAVTATLLVLRLAAHRRVLIDEPNARSSHAAPKPRGGGLGVVGGLLAGLAALALQGALPSDRGTATLLVTALGCAALGLWDDVRPLPAAPRLVVQFALAGWLVFETGPVSRLPLPAPLDIPLGIVGHLFPLVWLVGVMNFFNFMDGLDGLASGQGLAMMALVAACGWSSGSGVLALILASALAGFLLFNWWPSRIFLGDVGSLPVGFLIAGLPLLAPDADRPRAILVVAIGTTLFLLDPVWTLGRRLLRGARIGEAHREHLYQRLAVPGQSHPAVVGPMLVVGCGLALVGYAVWESPAMPWAGVAVAALAFAAEAALVRGRAA